MGILESEMQLSNKITKHLMEKALTPETISQLIELQKRKATIAEHYLKYVVNAAKEKWIRKDAEASQFVGNGASFMAIADSEIELLLCPEHQKHITRRECLDFSGKNQDACGGCKNFSTTRNILLGEKKGA